MSEAVDEIKVRLPIENLVAEYVVLKRIGKSLKGLCPFHSEKTPSFIVSPDKGIAYCFGCHKGGDIFRFLMEVENIDFAEALKLLAEKTGVELEKSSSKNFVKKDEKTVLIDIHDLSADFFAELLWQEEGREALSYLHGRGLTNEMLKQFRLGYAPDDFERTHQFLLKKGFNASQILQSGMALAKDTSMLRIYDRFRGRIMFPVMDGMGRVVGFGGRALRADQEPKYLNSPETPIYQKNQLLYGFYNSKSAIKSSKQAVVVEGYMDYLMAFQDGLKNVVAVNGTALTKRHLTQLKPYIEELVFSFDMDNAGKEAARRSFELTQEFEFLVKILILPSGKDIADYVKEKPGQLNGLMTTIQLFADYFYEDLFRRFDKNILADKRKILAEFSVLISKIKSSVERDGYVRRLASDLNVPEVQIYDEMNVMKFSKNHPAKQALQEVKKIQYQPEELLIGLLLNYPKYFFETKIDLSQGYFTEKVNTIYNQFLSNYNPQGIDQTAVLATLTGLDEELRSQASLMSLYVEEKYGDIPEDLIGKEVQDLVAKIQHQNMATMRQKLQRQLKEAEATNNQQEMERVLIELSNLSRVN
jgi:DNA primase